MEFTVGVDSKLVVDLREEKTGANCSAPVIRDFSDYVERRLPQLQPLVAPQFPHL